MVFDKLINKIIDKILDRYLNRNKHKKNNDLEFDIVYKDKIKISLKGKDLTDIAGSIINIFSNMKTNKKKSKAHKDKTIIINDKNPKH